MVPQYYSTSYLFSTTSTVVWTTTEEHSTVPGTTRLSTCMILSTRYIVLPLVDFLVPKPQTPYIYVLSTDPIVLFKKETSRQVRCVSLQVDGDVYNQNYQSESDKRKWHLAFGLWHVSSNNYSGLSRNAQLHS